VTEDQGHVHVRHCENSKKGEKRRMTELAVTPTHNVFKRSNLDTVASSAKRIFLCEGFAKIGPDQGHVHATSM